MDMDQVPSVDPERSVKKMLTHAHGVIESWMPIDWEPKHRARKAMLIVSDLMEKGLLNTALTNQTGVTKQNPNCEDMCAHITRCRCQPSNLSRRQTAASCGSIQCVD
jgi:hypothetical protein